MDIFKRLRSNIREYLRPKFGVEYVQEDVPETPKRKTLYIVTEDAVSWSAAMLCPCGCGAVLHLNLLPDEHPFWTIIQDPDKPISLSPSVWRRVGCQSHFWFRHGRIYWTQDQKHTFIRDLRLFLRRK